jgi:hypothetical protein
MIGRKKAERSCRGRRIEALREALDEVEVAMRLVDVLDRNGAQAGVEPRREAAVGDPLEVGAGLDSKSFAATSDLPAFPLRPNVGFMGRSIR